MARLLFLLIIISVLPGCDLRKREAELEKREANLREREQQLILKEKDLILREEALKTVAASDTITTDSTKIVPELVGNWNVKMTCTETTCSGSAVGDTKSETWVFAYQGNNVIARAMEGDKLVRVYSGQFNDNTLVLKEDVGQTALNPATSLTVRLNLLSPNNLDGHREIVRQNGCKIVYRMQMNKQ